LLEICGNERCKEVSSRQWKQIHEECEPNRDTEPE